MLEPWRSHYLRAMGVDIYLPRRELTSAAPSHQWAWDENAYEIPAPSNLDQPVDEVVDRAPPQRRNPTVTVRASADSPVSTRQRNPGAAPANTSAAVNLRIKLLIALSDSGVLIVDDVPAQLSQRNDGQRSDVQRLWSNVLLALQKRPSTMQLEQFDWPLPNLRNKQIELNETAARETLTGFLSKKIQGGNVQTIILLGENAQRWITSSQLQHLVGEHPLHWLHSIGTQEVLKDARRKRQWWLDLRPALPAH